MERDISVQGQHLAGKLDNTADAESREIKDRYDWKLCPGHQQHTWSAGSGPVCVTINYPAVAICELETRPRGQGFTLTWTSMKAYATPPWSLVGRVLAQAHQQKANLVLVAPVWKTQTYM